MSKPLVTEAPTSVGKLDPLPKPKKLKVLTKNLKKNKLLYLMILPGFIYFLIYKYFPMYGLIISFQNFKPWDGITGSEWVYFDHFKRLFSHDQFWMIFRNTIVLFLLNLLIFFPIPIILSLMLNEVRISLYKRSVQTIIYLPH